MLAPARGCSPAIPSSRDRARSSGCGRRLRSWRTRRRPVSRQRDVKALPGRSDYVEVRHGRLLTMIMSAPSSRSSRSRASPREIRGIHLVRPADRRTVAPSQPLHEKVHKTGSELCCIGEDGSVAEAGLIQSLANRTHPPIHHVGGRDDVDPARARDTEVRASNSRVGHSRFRILGDGRGAATAAPRDWQPAFTIPQWPCDIYSHRQTCPSESRPGLPLIARADLLDDAVLGPRSGRDFVLVLRESKQDHEARPGTRLPHFLDGLIHRQIETPGMERTSLRTFLPGKQQRYTKFQG